MRSLSIDYAFTSRSVSEKDRGQQTLPSRARVNPHPRVISHGIAHSCVAELIFRSSISWKCETET